MKSLPVSPSVLAMLATGFALAFSVATQAAGLTEPVSQPSAGLTRAEVMAEYWRAKAAGELPSASQVHGPLLSRALADSMGGGQAVRVVASKP